MIRERLTAMLLGGSIDRKFILTVIVHYPYYPFHIAKITGSIRVEVLSKSLT